MIIKNIIKNIKLKIYKIKQIKKIKKMKEKDPFIYD
jgi:hypothetical protein